MANKIYVYVDILSKNVVGSFIGENDVLTKRYLLTLCYEALEKAKFNFGTLKIFADRDVYVLDFNTSGTMEAKKVFSMSDLLKEAVSFLKDDSRVIYVDNVKESEVKE